MIDLKAKHLGDKLGKAKAGSALLLIMFVTAVLLIGLVALWRFASLSYEGAMQNYRAKRNFYACESLALYGICLIKQDLINLTQSASDKNDKSIVIYDGHWPKAATTLGTIGLRYDAQSKQIALQVNLFGNAHVQPVANTYIWCQKQSGHIQILNWQNSLN